MRIPEYDLVYYLYRFPLNRKPEITINPQEHEAFVWATPSAVLQLDFVHDFDACIEIAYGKTHS